MPILVHRCGSFLDLLDWFCRGAELSCTVLHLLHLSELPILPFLQAPLQTSSLVTVHVKQGSCHTWKPCMLIYAQCQITLVNTAGIVDVTIFGTHKSWRVGASKTETSACWHSPTEYWQIPRLCWTDTSHKSCLRDLKDVMWRHMRKSSASSWETWSWIVDRKGSQKSNCKPWSPTYIYICVCVIHWYTFNFPFVPCAAFQRYHHLFVAA
jgi:hypothetical protein